ncbi:signal recognition particle-docking protein FtsY [Weissella confusa]|uniref:signal recognition particle-docking protein FtsY n=1 Tax=Weissella confusa TaxID=1583 RepID=UPI00070544C2|nr:signal recognition particle-docking protein FtsY [Weissella confusa]KRN24012.1 signal recognition particle-docking protein FtsY [Weissella confusa]MBD1492259.1 signal recognition particle-docking protein FtsY [Weissella confusa]MBF7057453.1 signal recognition particle-docking protein FtsY [Weissella confusa]MBJ7622296.1 signal recognition particle-docking protein FtsY [Weissella confusa]MBJ7628201.1 signal recognition particle-docking protein FtsY [Weissella confusa]
MGLFDFFKKKPETPTVKVEVLYPNTWENGEAPAEPTSLAAEVLQPTAGQAVEIVLPTHEEVAPVVTEPVAETETVETVAEPEEAVVAESEAPVAEVTSETNLDEGLTKTRKTWSERWNAFMANFRSVDEDFFEDLEETLIGADVGAATALQLTDELRDEVKLQNAKSKAEISRVIVDKLVEHYRSQGVNEDASMHFAPEGPTVILFVGVNGVGKTTTIGKMSARYKAEGKKVLLAAADTFRAGATQQLQAWGERNDILVVAGEPNADPASVVYDGVKTAIETNADVLFVDTAGRLQNNVNLMQELAKMKRIITRELPNEPQEVLLALDATTGQNALQQARLFKDSTDVTGIVLTKLDGTAKGGIILPIRNELHLPVKWVGLGEQVGDLQPFDADDFAKSLFGSLLEDEK